MEHAWGVSDGVPGFVLGELEEEVAWEEWSCVPGSVGALCGEERQVCGVSLEVEGCCGFGFGFRFGCDDVPGRTASARRWRKRVGVRLDLLAAI